MPDDRFNPAEMERFYDAVDRLASGVPAPLLDDPDLQELLDLAGRLRRDLAPGLPDPAFRSSLKRQLTAPVPAGIVSLPDRSARAVRATRFPYVAAFGALAAVFVAVLLVGAFAVLGDDSNDDPPGLAAVSQSETETAIVSSLTLLSPTSPTSPTEPGTTADASPSESAAAGGAATITTSDVGSPTPVPPVATPASTRERATPTVVATLIATVEPTPQPTSDRGLAMTLPPVNSTTVEAGPVPATDDGAGGSITTMTYVLATDLPEIPPLAPAYLLAPPDDDPVDLVRQIAGALGIEGEVQVNADGGRMDYNIGSDDGHTFHWYPETGAFAYSSPDEDPGAEMSSEEVVENCRGWLSSLGYPIHDLADSATAESIDNTAWLVETPMESLPQPGYGHPLGVRMITNSEGKVVDAKGYWLKPMQQEDVDLISAEEAWAALTAHQGYWFGAGGAYIEGGELRVESIEVSYVLTTSPDGLILQPVIAMRGEYFHADGISSSGVTVFIQAGRSEAWYSGP